MDAPRVRPMIAASFPWLVLAAAALLVIGASARAEVTEVDGPGAKKLAAAGALVLDVRTSEEFVGGHAPGALNIPVQELAARVSEVGAEKKRPVVVYCEAGVRAARAADMLEGAGYEAVFNLRSVHNWDGPLATGTAVPTPAPVPGNKKTAKGKTKSSAVR